MATDAALRNPLAFPPASDDNSPTCSVLVASTVVTRNLASWAEIKQFDGKRSPVSRSTLLLAPNGIATI